MKFSGIIIGILLFGGFLGALFFFINSNIENSNIDDVELENILNKTREVNEKIEEKTKQIEETQGLLAAIPLANFFVGGWEVIKYSLLEVPKIFTNTINYLGAKFQLPDILLSTIIACALVSLIFLVLKSIFKWEF